MNQDNHIVLLRICQFTHSQKTRDELYKGNPSWLDTRLDWLEKYMLNNLCNQSDMGFWCFMLIDPEMPQYYKNKLYAYESLGFVKIIESNGNFSGTQDKSKPLHHEDELIISTYKSIKKCDSNEVFSSRLDSDDMVGIHWNSTVKNLMKENDKISLETVLLYNFLNKQTRLIKFERGSFVTVKSTINNYLNARYRSHTHVNALSINTDYPLVCMGIHDNNVTNHNWWPAGKKYPLSPNVLDQMFKIKE